jgi:deazaflavin-dependent oxidoreductase (nitroreductase family)
MRRPQGNGVVLAVLRSPAHRLLSGMALELRYSGRRSGRTYALPLQYVRDGARLVVVPQDAPAKTWWRNFATPRPVTLRLRGRLVDGVARTVAPDDTAWATALQAYAARWRRLAATVHGPIVVIDLDRSGDVRPGPS